MAQRAAPRRGLRSIAWGRKTMAICRVLTYVLRNRWTLWGFGRPVQERNCHLLRSDLFFLAEEPGLHEQSGEQQQGQSEIRVPRSKIQVV
jgi:hypothetical protein